MLDKGKFGSSRQMEGCENVRKKTPVRIISTFIHSANSNGKAEIVQNYNMNIGVGVDVMYTFIMIIENLQKSRKKNCH